MNVQNRNNAIDTLLADSLKELAASKPIEKITIKEITDKAGVIRPTFYNHFQDKYELLEWIVQNELITPMEPFLKRRMLKESMSYALTSMEKERDFYIQAVHLTGQNSFSDILKKAIRTLLLKFLSEDTIEKKRDYPWLTSQKIADFYAESISYVITSWANEGMKIPEAELADSFVFLYSHSIFEVIEESKGK